MSENRKAELETLLDVVVDQVENRIEILSVEENDLREKVIFRMIERPRWTAWYSFQKSEPLPAPEKVVDSIIDDFKEWRKKLDEVFEKVED